MKNIKKIIGILAFFCIGITVALIAARERHPYRNKNYQRDVLVIGCARSGTTYMASVFRKCGYRVGHEYLKRNGACSWEMTVDTEQVPWGHARNGAPFKHIFHQVRHPLKTITSCLGEPAQSFVFIRKHLLEITPEDSLLTQCAKYWYYWNLKAEMQAEWTYCIENLEAVWDEMQIRLGRTFDRAVLNEVPKTTNSRGVSPSVTWTQLKAELEPQLYENICALAQKYGYSTEF
jgi:hypothetical protein